MKKTLLVIAALALTTTGCAKGLHVEHDGLATMAKASYKTFALLRHPVGNDKRLTPMLLERTKKAMLARGYTLAPHESADLLVSWKILLRHEVEIDADASGATNSVSEQVAAKTMVLMLQSRTTHQVVWLGWSHTPVSQPNRLVELARTASAAVLKRLPRGTGSARVASR